MPAIVDMLMPAEGDAYAEMALETLAPYHAPFAEAGLTIRPRPWNLGPGSADVSLALFAWGYHTEVAAWLAMLDAWPATSPLLNPPALLRWNTRKTYLSVLEAAGVPIVPSLFGDADAASVAAAFDHFGTDVLVVKPQISAGSYKTSRVMRGVAIDPVPEAILQPFIPSVGDAGELSLFWIGGSFTHAARKVAAAGDFRIQPQFGGKLFTTEPSEAAMALSARALAALPAAPLYARIDFLQMADGSLALIELEAIEPDLYPDLAPDVPGKLAQAVAARLG